MAIFVSNPSTVSLTGVSTDPVDAALVLPEAGFTEELALAMRPRSLGNEAGPEGGEQHAEDADDTLADLQILPPDVLLHAVGDANFALAALSATAKLVVEETLSELDSGQMPGAAALLVGADSVSLVVGGQVSEAVADAQFSRTINLPGVETSNGLALAAGAMPEMTAPPAAAVSSEGLTPALDSTSAFKAAQSKALAAETAQALQVNSSLLITSTTNAIDVGLSQTVTAAVAGSPTNSVVTASTLGSTTELSEQASDLILTERADKTTSSEAGIVAVGALSPGEEGLKPIDTSNLREALVQPVGEQIKDVSQAALPNDAQMAQTSKGSSLPSPLPLIKPAVNLGETVPQTHTNQAVTQLIAPMSSHADVQSASLVSNLTGVTTLLGDGSDAAMMKSGRVAEKNAESALNFDAKLGIETPAEVPVPVAAVMPEMVSPRDQSLDELSATFVSSLVGGPQRPVTTVMDWVALQPQERPAPVEPHEVRLDGGAVQVEIQRLVKQGGGHIVMELTPPDQSKFTIELKLDDHGGAFLLVEGVSDSTRTRLEQSSSQLHEQFQQMGLNLQLDMRQHRESSYSGTSERLDNEPGAGSQPKEVSVAESRAAASARAREAGSSQIYLYA